MNTNLVKKSDGSRKNHQGGDNGHKLIKVRAKWKLIIKQKNHHNINNSNGYKWNQTLSARMHGERGDCSEIPKHNYVNDWQDERKA